MQDKLDVLRRYWGYDSFRECQAEIIDSVLAGRDTIGLLPTGGGKSLTFQVPAMLMDGVCVCVTPLISLMKDQVDNLRRRNITAVCIYSGQSRAERSLALERVNVGRAKIIYMAPERIGGDFLLQLRSWPVSLIVVDEAHCISQWGYDFRPSYLKISNLRALFPRVPVLALTASATPEVVRDMAANLQMTAPAVFRRSFARDNISYLVRRAEVKEQTLLRILQNTTGTAVVYVRSRARTAQLATLLADAGISALAYHAGLDPHDKAERQDRWMSGAVRVMVATNAFGMGIDKPDVRTVVHFDLPSSLEEYYQEAGRAGRDGLPSYAVLIVSPRDKATLTRRLNEQFPGREFILEVYEKLSVFLNISVGAGAGQVYDCDTGRLINTFSLPPRPTLAALNILTRAGAIEYHDDMDGRARLMFICDRREFYNVDLDPLTDRILQLIMRTYTGLFADYVYIDEGNLARNAGCTPRQVYEALLLLSRMHLVSYVPRRVTPYVLYNSGREETRHVVIPRSVYEVQYERCKARIDAMADYAFNDQGCRVGRMLAYFGEQDTPCGKCDWCRAARPARPAEGLRNHLLGLVGSTPGGLDIDALTASLRGDDARRAPEAVRDLIDSGLLRLDGNTLTLKR